MSISWYPGHMHKARKDITQALQRVDAVLELVDARLPYASENPLLNKLIGNKPRLRLLNKADLADPAVSRAWLDYYRQQGIDCLLCHRDEGQGLRQRLEEFTRKLPMLNSRARRIMIVGIPNVGKSTLINLLAQRKIARVGNEPAVTRARQEIRLGDNLVLLDTPGILWPRLEDQAAAYRLAISGAIRNTAIELEDVGLQALELLQRRYPELLLARYGQDPALDTLKLMEAIGRSRGCLVRGGVDYTKAGELILNELRSGKLGRISLEGPEDVPVGEAVDAGEAENGVAGDA